MTQEVIHGVSKHQYYKRWNDMVQRCYNVKDKQYKQYGARGISIDPVWDRRNPKGALNFVIWVEEQLAKLPEEDRPETFLVVRQKNTDNYSPDNCYITNNIDASQKRDFCVLDFEKVVKIRQHKKTNPTASLEDMCKLFGILHRYTLSKCLKGISWSNVDSVEAPVTVIDRRVKAV